MQSKGKGCNKSYMILYSTVNVTFLDNLGPCQIQRRFLQSSIHCYILGPAHVFNLNLLPNVLFLGRCYTPTKHIFKTKRAQNFGVFIFFQTNPTLYFDKKWIPNKSFKPSFNFGSPTVQLQETKMAVAPLVAPVASETQKIGKISGKTFWWLATVLGKGLGVLSSWRCQHEQPQWVKKQMGFSGRIFLIRFCTG